VRGENARRGSPEAHRERGRHRRARRAVDDNCDPLERLQQAAPFRFARRIVHDESDYDLLRARVDVPATRVDSSSIDSARARAPIGAQVERGTGGAIEKRELNDGAHIP